MSSVRRGGGQEKLNIWSVLMFEPSISQNLLKYEKKCEKNYSYVSDGVKLKKKIGGGLLALIFIFSTTNIFLTAMSAKDLYNVFIKKNKVFDRPSK